MNIYHLCEATIADPAILHGPTHDPQVSADDRLQTEAMTLATNVHVRLLDVDASMTIILAKKFIDMLDCGSPYESAVIQEPPVSKPRGRPRMARKNTFQGNPNHRQIPGPGLLRFSHLQNLICKTKGHGSWLPPWL